MRRLAELTASPRAQVVFNGLGTMAWLALLPVALLTNLKVSLIYIVVMSQWANIATHAGAWISALVNVRTASIEDRQHEQLDRIEQMEQAILVHFETAKRERRTIIRHVEPGPVKRAVKKAVKT